MEKRSIALKSVLFIITAALACICMFMNWFSVDLNLGAVQFDDVFGTVNAFTLSGTVSEIEETLGSLAGFLPEEFETLKVKSTILMICAYAMIASYVCAIALHILKKNEFKDWASLASAVLAVVTSVAFGNLMKDVYTFTGSSAAGNVAHDVVMKSPCLGTLLGGIASAVCTEMVGEWIVELIAGLIESIAAAVSKIVCTIVEFIKMLFGNIGFVLSDCAGAYAGVLAGIGVMEVTDSVWLGVIAFLGAAGLVAAVCLVVVSKLFYRDR